MIARLILAALLGAGLAAPALAGAGPSAPAGPEEGARANVHVSSFRLPNDINEQTRAIEEAFAPPEAGTYVDLPSINVPVVRGGALQGYAFVMVRLHLAEGVDDWRVRDQSHFLLDSAVRAAHRAPFEHAGADAYDDTATRAALEAAITAHMPAASLARIELLGGDVRLVSR